MGKSFRMKEHSRAAVIGDMNTQELMGSWNALPIADGINWEETKVLNICDIGGMCIYIYILKCFCLLKLF